MADRPGIIVEQCGQCNERFTSNEDISIRDGKAFHPQCVKLYKHNNEIQQLKSHHPYLTDVTAGALIWSEGFDETLDAFDNNPWIVLTSNSATELIIFTSPDQNGVEEFIKTCHETNDEIATEIQEIYNNGIKYDYTVDITVTLSQS